MSWQTENALKRVFNVFKRFKEQKGKIWDNDIEALKLLNSELENKRDAYVNDNLLYAKLLCTALRYRTENYGSIKMALKSLKNDLETPLNHQIEFLQLALNRIDDVNYLKSIGVDLENENFSKIEELNGKEKEFLEMLKTKWTYEKVYKSFMNSANDFLHDINNYN
jgi:hypothetical protein